MEDEDSKRAEFMEILFKIERYRPHLTPQMEEDLFKIIEIFKEQKFEDVINPEDYAQWIYAAIKYLENNTLKEDKNYPTI